MLLTSLSNEKIKYLKSLKNSKNRDINKEYLLEGYHLILEAYKNNLVKEVFILEDKDYDFDIKKTYVNRKIMKELTNLTTPPDIIGLCSMKKDNKDIGSKILILDNIQDPGNLGTIIRSSKAFNIDTIVLGSGCCSQYNDKVLRACQGINFYINIIEKDLIEYIPFLKSKGIKIYGTNVNNGIDISKLDSNDKNNFALIMGNEGQGVKKEILSLCDKYIYIKLNNNVESLNVGVATSILLYELNK